MTRGKWSHQHNALLQLARREQQVMDLGRNVWRRWKAAYEAARATMKVEDAVRAADEEIEKEEK